MWAVSFTIIVRGRYPHKLPPDLETAMLESIQIHMKAYGLVADQFSIETECLAYVYTGI